MKRRLIRTSVAALLGALVGVFLTVLLGGHWLHNVTVGFTIGLVSAIVPQVFAVWFPSVPRPLTYAIGIPVGMLAGVVVQVLWPQPIPGGFQRTLVVVLATSVVFGGAIAALFFLQARKTELEGELRAAELRKLEAERAGLEAQLKMLQAQIEPHFLFNTLANVTALIGADAALARRLLDRLIVYLRATLARTRAGQTTLADEMDLLRAYLDICRIRMGERLRYSFDVPENLLAQPFPPMLLQPLVENAVKHGLEPKLADGELRIAVINSQARLRIAVVDNGVGFVDTPSSGTGTGIANVRARLSALHGDAARLVLEENAAGGVTATLELPV
jgi:sensor histidine kinase YesM